MRERVSLTVISSCSSAHNTEVEELLSPFVTNIEKLLKPFWTERERKLDSTAGILTIKYSWETESCMAAITEDAMVMFGTYWSDLPKNLQAAAQMCGFPFPWKALGETDLEWYGCADVDATLCVYEAMVKVLEGECVA